MIMAGLGILIYSLLAGAAAIGRGIENEKVKSQTYKIDEKGRPTYMDRYGKEYINGEKVIPKIIYGNNLRTVYVGQRTGTVYRDPNDRFLVRNEENKQKAIAEGKFAYEKWNFDWNMSMTTEVVTDRTIASATREKDGTCWICYARNYKPKDAVEAHGQYYYSPTKDETDERVQITEKDFYDISGLAYGSCKIRDNKYHIYDNRKY